MITTTHTHVVPHCSMTSLRSIIMLGVLMLLGIVQQAQASLAYGDANDTISSDSGLSTLQQTFTGTVYQGGIQAYQPALPEEAYQHISLMKEGLLLGGTTASPIKKVVFNLANQAPKASVVQLKIEGIEGLHTLQGTDDWSRLHHPQAVASPTRLKVNGQLLQSFTVDHHGTVVVDIPVAALKQNGFNTLQFEAGYMLDTNNRVAYESVQVGALSLLY